MIFHFLFPIGIVVNYRTLLCKMSPWQPGYWLTTTQAYKNFHGKESIIGEQPYLKV